MVGAPPARPERPYRRWSRPASTRSGEAALARLQGPLAAAVDPGAGRQAPVFASTRSATSEAHSLRISPTVDLTYAVFDGLP